MLTGSYLAIALMQGENFSELRLRKLLNYLDKLPNSCNINLACWMKRILSYSKLSDTKPLK